MNALIPPIQSAHPSAAAVRREGFRTFGGILRWNGRHYYLLLSSLFAQRRFEDVQRVWTVMKAIGFVDFHMDERNINSLIALIRRSSERDAETKPHSDENLVVARLEEEKALRRRLVIDLETIAKKKGFSLQSNNQRAAQLARVAESVHGSSSLPHAFSANELAKGEVGGDNLLDDLYKDDKDRATNNRDSLKVGDFNSLLRVARSLDETQRTLDVMEKIGISKCAETYASLIASLHNPDYRLNNYSPNLEVPKDMGDGKAKYEDYKNQRIAQAKIWFEACPAAQRTADVYNEMLYLLRDKSRVNEFNTLLAEYRGNTLHESEAVQNNAEGTLAVQTSQVPTLVQDGGSILPPQWRVSPNVKTYELLIQHAGYMQDWQAFWELHEEMHQQNIRGSSRLYRLLLKEVSQHPPQEVERVVGGISAFILKLSEQMQRDGLDIMSLEEGMSLVNAWSASRKST
ncbi:unnamed protein product [Phytomonas sp. EM1]|nr:unnamed protein product [Phytomonas sp. EM1]|eukprot:CCW62778.1 unnamed protein product [Phytomonas sp. isolate EM1]